MICPSVKYTCAVLNHFTGHSLTPARFSSFSLNQNHCLSSHVICCEETEQVLSLRCHVCAYVLCGRERGIIYIYICKTFRFQGKTNNSTAFKDLVLPEIVMHLFSPPFVFTFYKLEKYKCELKSPYFAQSQKKTSLFVLKALDLHYTRFEASIPLD